MQFRAGVCTLVTEAMQEGPVVQHAAIIPSLTLSLQAKILNLMALALRRAK